MLSTTFFCVTLYMWSTTRCLLNSYIFMELGHLTNIPSSYTVIMIDIKPKIIGNQCRHYTNLIMLLCMMKAQPFN